MYKSGILGVFRILSLEIFQNILYRSKLPECFRKIVESNLSFGF